jgi:NADPH:quinone reductase-like Zn-dependent oxidoreductase
VPNLATTAGNAKSRAYLIAQCGLSDVQIVDYKDADFIEQAMKRNGGGFDVVLDLVGGKMLSTCCVLLAVDGNLASMQQRHWMQMYRLMCR